jgi:membrane protein YqaA with SNARE-associated domain
MLLLSNGSRGAFMFITSIRIAGGSWTWVFQLGGPGLIVVGLIDNSIIPIPGGMDLFTILLTAHHRAWWVYYGAMATLGAVIGGYVTYRLARKGGKASLEKKIGRRRAEGVYKKFEKGGFTTVFLGSVMPPPFPLVPVLMAAGIMQYEPRKFLTALTLGRGIRFFALAFLGRLYGTTIVHWLNRYYQPFLYALITLGILGGAATLVYFKWYRPQRQQDERRCW